jgi:hypothetical protein
MRALYFFPLLLLPAWGADLKDPSEAEVKEIIAKFANKESEFAKARERYTYRQSLKMHELDDRGNVTGKWEVVADVLFSANGKRTERVVRAPVPTLKGLIITPEDEADLRNVQPFVLTSKDIDKYDVRYIGREKLDEISCYTFSVKPKKLEHGMRFFQGQVWVDDKDLQIVKSYGRGVGQQKKGSDQQFPKFETYREQIDGKYWFPTYTIANDTLVFKDSSVRIRMSVKYEDYKYFGADVKVTFGETLDPAKPATTPKKP